MHRGLQNALLNMVSLKIRTIFWFPQIGNQGRGGDRRSKDYHLTLDTAKETAMVERNEKGRQIRRYFIECEKRLRQQETKVEKVLSGFMPAIMEAIKLEDKKNTVPH